MLCDRKIEKESESQIDIFAMNFVLETVQQSKDKMQNLRWQS